MIDFTSSREGADPQTKACCRLLAAVIVQAIRDAAMPLSATEKRAGYNLQREPRKAVLFLFGTGTCFPAYCALIGLSAHHVRQALTADHGSDMLGSKLFRSGLNLRPLRIRERFYQAEAVLGSPAQDLMVQDDGDDCDEGGA